MPALLGGPSRPNWYSRPSCSYTDPRPRDHDLDAGAFLATLARPRHNSRHNFGREKSRKPPNRPQHRGLDHGAISVKRCAPARNGYLSRGGLVLLRQFPELHAQPVPPRESTPGTCAATGGRRNTTRCHSLPVQGVCVTLRIPCPPLRGASIRTPGRAGCRCGRQLTQDHIVF